MDAPSVAADAVTELAVPPRARRSAAMAEWFVRENAFYLLASFLVILGCYRLMPGSEAKGASLFLTLKAALILQGYEWLVIATAAFIVWRLRALGDASTLLLIALALMLDPTFFSNSFFTMPDTRARAINYASFALIPAKLLILGAALRIRFSPRLAASILVAGAATYLGGGPLTLDSIPFGFTHARYYYLLAWAPALVAAAMPPCAQMAETRAAHSEFATADQLRRLRLFLFLVPFAVTALHVLEVSEVHWVRLYPLHFAPMTIGLAILTIKNADPKAERFRLAGRCLAADFFALLTLGLSSVTANTPVNFSGSSSQTIYTSSRTLELPDEFAASGAALFIAVMSAVALYLQFYRKLGYRPALYRAAALGSIVLCAGVWKLAHQLGAQAWLAAQIQSAQAELGAMTDRLFAFCEARPYFPAGMIWILSLMMAIRFVNGLTWAICGASGIALLGALLPGPAENWIPELAQSILLLVLLLNHKFQKHAPQGRSVFAVLIVSIAIGRFFHSPAAWSGAIVAAEFAGLILAGYFLRTPGYWAAAAIQLAMLAGFGWHRAQLESALLYVVAGLALFAAGVAVTFTKQFLLERLQPPEPAPQSPPEAGTPVP